MRRWDTLTAFFIAFMEARINSYKDLKVWVKANDLALEVFDLTDTFPAIYSYDLTTQLRRSILSVPTNIAEGCASRHSRELLKFLNIARRSLSEAEHLLYFAARRGLLDKHKLAELNESIAEVGRMLNGVMKTIADRITN